MTIHRGRWFAQATGLRKPSMSESPSKIRTTTARVCTLAAVLGAVGTALSVLVVPNRVELPLGLSFGWLLAAFFVAASAPLFLEVESNTFSLSLSEIPMVLGLLCLPRGPLVGAALGGWFISQVFNRRRSLIRFVFNAPLTLFEVTMAIAVFDVMTSVVRVNDWRTWLALLAALSTAIVLSTCAVNLVIVLSGDTMTLGQAARHVFLGVVNAVMATSLSVLAVIVLRETPVAILPIMILAGIVILPMRRQAKLQRRYDSLLLLHQFTAGLTTSSDLSATLQSVLTETARVLRAANATIVLPRNDDHVRHSLGAGTAEVPQPGDAIWTSVIDHAQPICLDRGSTESGGYLEAHGMKDMMAVPLLHGDDVIGALVVSGRLSDVSTFDNDDLSIFATMANQTTVTLENLRLIDKLRSESADREHQALHDVLTGLPNRLYLYRTLDEVLSRTSSFAVAILDLNRFKEVNDTLGHHAGDQVLVETAMRLRKGLPSSAFLARLGGDEFAIVLPGVASIKETMTKLQAMEVVFTAPFQLDAMSVRIGASIGFVFAPDHGSDRETLLKRADIAMYAAKMVRGSAIRSFDRSQEHSSSRALELVGELRAAVESDALTVVFQPKAELASGRILGAEALARWNHPRFGEVSPNEFIPLAEQSGLIDAITDIVLTHSLAACTEWRRSGFEIGVAVNVDAQTLLAPGFALRVLRAIRKAGLPPSVLTLEITERELVHELDDATAVIDDLRSQEVRFSIDDFGTGYSSLSYLKRLPVDELKIDRSFVVNVADSPQDAAIVKAIADLATGLGLRTVVEGIEDARTWETVTSLGCHAGQGFFLTPGLQSAEFLQWVRSRATSEEHAEDLAETSIR
jgi:diguanylate cyclase (GGDEF)-like protein